jgi:hypothetical protein
MGRKGVTFGKRVVSGQKRVSGGKNKQQVVKTDGGWWWHTENN